MAGLKKFNTRDLVLKVDTSYDPAKYPLDDWEYFLDVLCGNCDYQKAAILTAIHYFISPKYKSIEDLVKIIMKKMINCNYVITLLTNIIQKYNCLENTPELLILQQEQIKVM
jgi:hypothetical protein